MQIAFTVDLHRGNSRSSDVTSHCERGFGAQEQLVRYPVSSEQIMGVGTIGGTATPQQSRPESAPPLEMFLQAGAGPGVDRDQVLISKVTQGNSSRICKQFIFARSAVRH